MRYDKALASGWPIATGMIEGACRFVIEDRFGITGARWSPDGAEDILKLRAIVVNGDLDDYMNYYKTRYRNEIHLSRYDPGQHRRPRPHRMTETPGNDTPLRKTHPIETSHGLRTCFEVIKHRRGKKDLVARFGGIPLKQDRRAAIRDPGTRLGALFPRKELLRRLLVRGNADSARPGLRWQFTRSPVSRNSGNREQVSPHGRHSWRKCDGKRLSSAPHVMYFIHTEPVTHAA